jgi:ABC-type glutathione transport system ATPase component
METLLQVRNLTVRYRLDPAQPFTAVQDVSFDIARGETLGLMGESGCGKSTIAQALLALLPRDRVEAAGSIMFRGLDLPACSERAMQKLRGAAISMVYQEPELALSPVMSVGQQVAEVIRAHRLLPWKQCRSEAQVMLERVGLAQTSRIFAAYPHQLSGGQRQRVVLAQALACSPALLIADEPTAHLDARSQSEFLSLLENLKRESLLSILLISHTPEIQARLADRLLVMQTGRIIEQGRFAEIYRDPAHDYTRAILGSPVSLRPRADLAVDEQVPV